MARLAVLIINSSAHLHYSQELLGHTPHVQLPSLDELLHTVGQGPDLRGHINRYLKEFTWHLNLRKTYGIF